MPRREGGKRTSINHIVVTGFEKRKQPSKHYVFIIDIIWDNDERYEVFRRYSEFFTLNESLKTEFSKHPELASNLPLLPSRKIFGRSHVEKVAEARVESINEYCQSLIRLEPKISQNKHVISFLSPKIGDRVLAKLRLHRPATLHPQMRPAGNTVWEDYCVVASFVGEGPNQLSANSGDQVRVINKDTTGWWYVERRGKVGWMPESYLKKSSDEVKKEDLSDYMGLLESDQKSDQDSRESSPGLELEAQDYKAIESFTAHEPGQMSFDVDDVITVLDKMEDGWWFVAKGKEEGWVPCGYLEPLNQHDSDEDSISESAATQDTAKYKTMAAYTADEEDEISFSAGSIATVLHKSLTGWWMVSCEGKTGLAPATYMKLIEEDETSSTSSVPDDSGVDTDHSGGGMPTQKTFKQSPRQQTVRKKHSRKKPSAAAKVATITEEGVEKGKDSSQRQIRKMSDSPMSLISSPFTSMTRKYSSPDPSPKVAHGTKQTLTVSPTSTPPRPRVTLIKRAKDTPQENIEERHSSMSRSLSPSPGNRRSPSPARRSPSPSPQSLRKFKGSNENIDKKEPSTEKAPTAQETAETLIKYVLSLNNPELKSALIQAVSSDQSILEALKK